MKQAAPLRPQRPRLRPENVPHELQELRRWVCWSYTWSPRKKKWDKPPRQPNGAYASSTDSATWCDFERVISAVEETHRFDGIGFVLVRDGFAALDLDRCIAAGDTARVREGDLPKLEDWARAVVGDLDSYTELSPSARGIRIFVRGVLRAGRGNRNSAFEAYDRSRYVTVTGDHVIGTPRGIENRQGSLDRVTARMLPATSVALASHGRAIGDSGDDDELLERARSAKNGFRFEGLFDRGELAAFGNDHSRADLALCSMLAFWCAGNAARVDRLFRRSALYRPKWDERHSCKGETYGQMTVERSLSPGLG